VSTRKSLIEALTENQREFYEERAAIKEYVAGATRRAAEASAWLETQRLIQQGALPRCACGGAGVLECACRAALLDCPTCDGDGVYLCECRRETAS